MARRSAAVREDACRCGYIGAVKAAVVLNVHSRKAAALRDGLRALLERRGVEIESFEPIEDSDAIAQSVTRAAARDVGCVVVGGGDGSMSAAAGALAHRAAVLGVLPLGTGNSFAETLGIGDDLERAADAIAAGRIARVDLGIVNERYFANFATIGFPAEVAEATASSAKRFFGPLAYVVSGIVPGLRDRTFRADIRADAQRASFRTRQIVVASGRYYGKQPLTAEARVTDGRLTLFTTTGTSPAELARAYAAIALGVQGKLRDARVFSARSIEVATVPPQRLNVDGEAAGGTPANFRVDPGALRVFVPPEFFRDEGSP